MAEIDSAAQYVRVLFEGTEVCFRIGQSVTKDALFLIKNIMKMLKWLTYNAKYGREIGGTNIKNLILRDSNLIAAQIPKDYINEFKKSSKKMGILYTRVPSKDSDTYTVLLHAASFPRVKQIIDTINKKAEKDNNSCRAEMVSMEECVASLKPGVFDLNDSPANITDEITGEFVKKNSLESAPVLIPVEKEQYISDENEKAVRINITGKTEEKNIWISKKDLNQLELSTDNIITIPIKRDKKYKVYDNENKFTGETIVAEDIEKYMSFKMDEPQHGIEKLEYQADRYSKWHELVSSDNAEELIIPADSIVFEDDKNLGFILESGQESMEVTIEKKYCFKANDINISGDADKIHAVLMKDKTYSGRMHIIGKPEKPFNDMTAKSIINFKNSAEQKNTVSDLSEILKKTESVTKDTILRNVNKQ